MKRKLALLGISIFTCCQLNAQREIGVNMATISPYASQLVYVDAMKQSSGWLVTELSQSTWGIDTIPIQVDSLGNPTQTIPFSHYGQPYIVQTNFLAAQPTNWSYPTGNYTLIFEGTGTIEMTENGWQQFQNGGTYTVPVSSSNPWGIVITITASDSLDPIRNVRFIMPGFENTYQTQPFHPDFLALLNDFNPIRFMKPCRVEENPIVQWSDRTLPNYYSYFSTADTGGVMLQMPYEDVIRICNLLGKDAWVCVPHMADDNYVTEMAQLFHDSLTTNAYIEYGNETWNGEYTQVFNYVNNMGLSLNLSTDPWEAGQRYYTQRSIEVWQLFDNVYGSGSTDITRVICSLPWNYIGNIIQNAFQDPVINPTGYSPDAYGIGPYFGVQLVEDMTTLGVNCTWTVDQFLDHIEDSIPIWMNQMVPQMKTISDAMGIPLVTYEGGHHITSGDFTIPLDPCSRALVEGANRHPRMTDIYCDYYDHWYDTLGGETFVTFVLAERPNQFGFFGLVESIFQNPSTSPKWVAHENCAFNYNSTSTNNDIEFVEETMVYPNPSAGIYSINISDPENYQMALYNAYGQLIRKGALENSTINIIAEANGIYLLHLMHNNKRKETYKLLKH
jgi:hypothetical protein